MLHDAPTDIIPPVRYEPEPEREHRVLWAALGTIAWLMAALLGYLFVWTVLTLGWHA